LKSRRIPLPPLFVKGEKVEFPAADLPRAFLPMKREDGRDLWKGLFKTPKSYEFLNP
jgi:hypothetical protein